MAKPDGTRHYDVDKMVEVSKAAIKEHNITFIEDICAFLPCCLRTFYAYKMHEMQDLKDLIHANKVKMKQGLKKKWYDDGSAAERIALYKLLASPEERDALNGHREVEKDDDSQETEFDVVDGLHGED
jgi:hypothetical protein|tara:strand:- start:10460 stop:10843 length:384 start_codon:yes stop_codon:yes gene_type:complete